ncbi:MerR family transcriptional regulator [Microbacterium sp. P06]|uniref:MerR family transcriptional regulator n=1 Tax=unclassified Microbacterium TaxID=2609290 RepID=UPI0037455FC8
MKISQLAVDSGVSVGTIKYYLREGLLHDGALTAATQATYDDTHRQRLGLIRALVGPAGLSISAAREVLATLDGRRTGLHDLLGHVHHTTGPRVGAEQDLTAAQQLLDRWGWRCEPGDLPTVGALARALDGLTAAGFTFSDDELDDYAARMLDLAHTEVARVPVDSPEAAARYVALGTVLAEPLLLALRRLGHQHASRERFGDAPTP